MLDTEYYVEDSLSRNASDDEDQIELNIMNNNQIVMNSIEELHDTDSRDSIQLKGRSILNPSMFVQVEAGYFHTCVLNMFKKVGCYG